VIRLSRIWLRLFNLKGWIESDNATTLKWVFHWRHSRYCDTDPAAHTTCGMDDPLNPINEVNPNNLLNLINRVNSDTPFKPLR
jgi:hypothetical protein